VLLRGYYALEDTRTPFIITIVFSIVLLILMFPLFNWARDGGRQVAAIALAYSLAYWVGFAITWFVLARRLGSMQSKETGWVLLRIVIAGVVSLGSMGACLLGLIRLLGGYHPDHKGELLVIVLITSVIGLLVYLVSASILRVPEVTEFRRLGPRALQRVRG